MVAANELVLIDQARRALAEAKTVCDAAEVRNKAIAVAHYLKRKEGAEEAARHANEIRLRAERRIGEILAETVKPGGDPKSRDTTLDLPPEVTRDQSSKYQRIAQIPEEVFEGALQEPEPTTAGLVRVANEYRREKRKAARYDDAGFVEAGELKGRFRVIYADPPWSYGNARKPGQGLAGDHYPTMSQHELCALPIREHSLPDSVLFLWATAPQLVESLAVMSAWEFKYKAQFVWDKIKHNMGHYNSVRHELLLIGTRGACTPDVRQLFDSVQSIARTNHSEKPERFREIINTLYPNGPRLELFARARRPGWVVWGNEV